MKQHLLLFLSLPAALGFTPATSGRFDVSLNARRGKGLDVPSGGAGNARGIGGDGGAGEYVYQWVIASACFCGL